MSFEPPAFGHHLLGALTARLATARAAGAGSADQRGQQGQRGQRGQRLPASAIPDGVEFDLAQVWGYA